MPITPFFMFDGQAEEAMTFYVSLFPHSRVVAIRRYGAGEAGPEGKVMHATFELDGRAFQCIDSPAKHAFTFTPSISMMVDCASEAEIDALHAKLTDGGQTMMPLGEYPFAKKFAWVSDRFGISWQLRFGPASG